MTADPNRKLKVFLCHSSHDKPAVREIYARLKAEGWIDPWLDEEKLFPGQDWDLEIEKAVEATDAVLVFLSDNSVNKEGYIQREIRLILNMAEYKPEGTLFILPLRLNECPLPRRLRSWHYVDYFPEERKEWAYGRLLGSLKMRAKKLGIDIAAILKEKAEQEKKELTEKKRKEQAEKERKEKAAREAVERAERERITNEKREAEEKARLEKETEEEQKRKATTEKALREKIACEKAESEEKERKKKEVREVAEKATKERIAREKQEIEEEKKNNIYEGIQSPVEIDWAQVYLGKFKLGSNEFKDEKPPFLTGLDAFFVSKTLVTNTQYSGFIAANGYKRREYWSGSGWDWCSSNDYTQPEYWDDEKWNLSNHPVVGVSWYEAEAFCNWAQCRLLTEAEWEKAARGIYGNLYPWGRKSPTNALANFGFQFDGTTPVRMFSPKGDSPYKCADMGGNVFEWVADWYDKAYYAISPSNNPPGPEKGTKRSIRGGAWNSNAIYLRTSSRESMNPEARKNNIGFRCAMDAD